MPEDEALLQIINWNVLHYLIDVMRALLPVYNYEEREIEYMKGTDPPFLKPKTTHKMGGTPVVEASGSASVCFWSSLATSCVHATGAPCIFVG